MRAWYDIVSLDAEGRADAGGVHASTEILEALISRELERGIPSNRIVLAGFSMGGAIAINTALHTAHRLAGLMAELRKNIPKRLAELKAIINGKICIVYDICPSLWHMARSTRCSRCSGAGSRRIAWKRPVSTSTGMNTRCSMLSVPTKFGTSGNG